MRNAVTRLRLQTPHLHLEPAQARLQPLGAPLTQHLRPHTDAQQRGLVLQHPAFEQRDQTGRTQALHAGVESAVAGQYQFISVFDLLRIGRYFTGCTDPLQHVGDRRQIADLVVNYRNHGLPRLKR